MAKLTVKRRTIVSFLKMTLEVDGVDYALSTRADSIIDISEGKHFLRVKSGGFSATKELDTTGINVLIVKSCAQYCVSLCLLILIFPTSVLYPLGIVSGYFWGLLLFVYGLVGFYTVLFKKKSFFIIGT